MGDWLGTGRVANQSKVYRPFAEARAFVHSLGLESVEDWVIYRKSGKNLKTFQVILQVYTTKNGMAGMTGSVMRGSTFL
jgi:hypothetical protein